MGIPFSKMPPWKKTNLTMILVGYGRKYNLNKI
jgi:hypothetical protein